MVPLIFRPLVLAAAALFGIAGPALAQSSIARGQYNTSPPTLSNGQLGNLQLDSSGALITTVGGGGGGTVTANQGTPAVVGNAWPTYNTIAGAANAVGNPGFVSPGTGATWVTWTANRLELTPTVQNAAYASGNNIGGLVTFTLPRTASGYLQSVGIQFIGGATTAINAYCFDSNPTGSTFTDKSTFTIAAADEAKRINKTGYSLTPSAVTGDTVTGAAVDNLAKPFVSTGTIYCAYASTGTFTPASTTDMRVNIAYVQSAQ